MRTSGPGTMTCPWLLVACDRKTPPAAAHPLNQRPCSRICMIVTAATNYRKQGSQGRTNTMLPAVESLPLYCRADQHAFVPRRPRPAWRCRCPVHASSNRSATCHPPCKHGATSWWMEDSGCWKRHCDGVHIIRQIARLRRTPQSPRCVHGSRHSRACSSSSGVGGGTAGEGRRQCLRSAEPRQQHLYSRHNHHRHCVSRHRQASAYHTA